MFAEKWDRSRSVRLSCWPFGAAGHSCDLSCYHFGIRRNTTVAHVLGCQWLIIVHGNWCCLMVLHDGWSSSDVNGHGIGWWSFTMAMKSDSLWRAESLSRKLRTRVVWPRGESKRVRCMQLASKKSAPLHLQKRPYSLRRLVISLLPSWCQVFLELQSAKFHVPCHKLYIPGPFTREKLQHHNSNGNSNGFESHVVIKSRNV